jgi:hypothetical protein
MPPIWITLLIAGAVLSAATCRAQQLSLFGTEWPPLEECLEHSDETGAWAWKNSAKTKEHEDAKVGILRFHFGSQRICFYDNGTFTTTFTYKVTRQNKYWRTKVVKAEEEIVRRGSWKLTRRPLTRQERQLVLPGVTALVQIYFLELDFRDNNNPTHYERAEEIPLNGLVMFALDESREYLDGKGRIKPVPEATNPQRLKWACFGNPEGILLFEKVPSAYLLVHSS